jgi:hypothetical protein
MSGTVGVAGECLLSPFCQDTQHGRGLRGRVIAGDAWAAGKTVYLTEVFTSVLQEAAMKAGLAGDRGPSRVNAPHSKEVFRATMGGMPNGSAPGGGSGISCAELKCMSGALNLLSDLHNVSVAAFRTAAYRMVQKNCLHDTQGGGCGCH